MVVELLQGAPEQNNDSLAPFRIRSVCAAVTAEQWPELSESELIKNIQSVQICLGEEEMEIIIRIKGV